MDVHLHLLELKDLLSVGRDDTDTPSEVQVRESLAQACVDLHYELHLERSHAMGQVGEYVVLVAVDRGGGVEYRELVACTSAML